MHLPMPIRIKNRGRLGLLAATILFTAALAVPQALAVRNLVTGFDEPIYVSDAAREAAFAATVDEGAGIARIGVTWRTIVAAGTPSDPTNPADPAYDFSSVDAAVRGAEAHGLDTLLTVYDAPDFAEGSNRPPTNDFHPAGTWKPDPGELAKFAEALATRYSGSFIPAGEATPLPRVNNYEAWNEENLWLYSDPQYEGDKLVSVEHYRKMLNRFYDAVKAVNPGARIVLGGLAPYGDDPGGMRTRPLIFLRKLLCLSDDLGRTPCPKPAKFDVLGAHPINTSGGPTLSAINPDDASSADLDREAAILDAAQRHHTIKGKGKRPIWVTEFWWRTLPHESDPSIPTLKQHGRWIEQAMYLYWKAGATVAINLQLMDEPIDSGANLQTGVLEEDGSPKPAATSFRFPFVLDRRSPSTLFAWGKAPASGKLTIERKTGGGWRNEKRLNVGEGKVYTAKIKGGGGRYRARVGNDESLVWSQK